MEHKIYDHIAKTISDHRTWVDAETSKVQSPFLVLKDGLICFIHSDTLTLRVIRPRYGYDTRQKWTIPEFVLETNVRQLKSEDPDFWDRYTQDRLTLKDIEKLIRMSTYGIVSLDLDTITLWD